MKARVYSTENQIRRAVKEESERQTTVIYEKAMKDAAYQCFATMMVVLHREFGFGGERLRRVKDLTEAEFFAMMNGVLGKSYDTTDCVRFLKETYNIDFEESMYGRKTL